MYRVKLSTKI